MRPVRLLPLALLLTSALPLRAQNDSVAIVATPVSGHVHMLTGMGGNIGVSAGRDGVFLVDDQFAPLTDRIRVALARLSDRPVRFVLNTHWHGDHTGGNENLGRAGVLIVAHENVRRRMGTEQFIAQINERVPASTAAALPVVTFSEAVTFYLNGDSIHVFRVEPAHTDGDAVVHFRGANVVHMGNVFFNGRFPFVDQSSGGTVAGMIAAADRVLALTDTATRFIPGHGALAGRAELQAYRDMLRDARARVSAAMAGGRTLEQVKAARPLAPLEDPWGRGFIRADAFVEVLFRELSATR
jgi:cyclase